MTRNSHSLHACAWLVALASVGAAGCLCPPCPGKGPVAGPEAAGANAGPVSKGARLVIWDGDEVGTGAQPWEGCDQKPQCQVKVGAEAGTGTNGSNGLKFHADGGGWIGMGWNLFGWYPENAGVDLTPYSHLTFQIRVEGKTPGVPTETGAASVLLGCSANKKNDSASVPLDKFVRNYADGKWHKVSIPISAFTKGAGAKFDPHSFWEFRVSTWSGGPRSFDIFIDEIAAEKL